MDSSLDKLIFQALREDCPHGDITARPLRCHKKPGKACLVTKSGVVLSGSKVFEAVFKKVSKNCKMKWHFKDGQKIKEGKTVAEISGDLASLLLAERTALNFLGHLSGIATLTHQFAEMVSKTKTKIIDTRKTTPLLRALEKQAVLDGGGFNHRMNLSDQVLIKENHIRAAGGIPKALMLIRKSHPNKFVEIEVTDLNELKEVLSVSHQWPINRVMLDNMSLQQTKSAVDLVRNSPMGRKIEIEASGNMSLSRVAAVARTGVDFISVGMITHSAPTADLSLQIIQKRIVRP